MRILAMKQTSIDRQIYSLSNIGQLQGLAKRGHSVTMIVGRIGDSRVTLPPLSAGFRLVTILLRRQLKPLSSLVFELKAYFHILRSHEPLDCVILDANTLPVFLPMFLLRRLLSGRPVLFLRIESNPVETGGRLRSLLLSTLDSVSVTAAKLLCDRIFFISPMMAEMYSRRFALPAEKVKVWPSSVDTGLFEPAKGRRSATDRLRKELGISNQLIVLYHGTLSKARGIMETVEAFRILRKESVNVTLVLLGYGPLREKIERYVRENGLEGTVQVRGPAFSVAEVLEYIALCDVGIVPLPDHPWWRYQCSIKVLELLAMKKPLIVSDIPANRSVIGDAPVALYLEGTSPREIADGIRRFLRVKVNLDPALGREIAASFSVERISMMLEHEISSAINSRNVKQRV